jgi:hypothetical protein
MTLNPETVQMLHCAIYGSIALVIATPLAAWWEKRNP